MRLPEFLTRLSPVGETLDALDAGEQAFAAEVEERNECLSVSTAGEEGLARWERDYGLSHQDDIESRRARIRAALLGGQTLTRAALLRLARLLGNADDAAIGEDFTADCVTLNLFYDGRTPEGVTALREAVALRAPSHLTVEVAPIVTLRGSLRRYHTLVGKVFLTLSDRV